VINNTSSVIFNYADIPKTIFPPITTIQSNLLKFKINSDFKCSTYIVPKPIKDLQLLPIYVRAPDGTLTTERNASNITKNTAILEPVIDFKTLMGTLVIKLITDQDETKEIATCIQNALLTWANTSAITGKMTNDGETQGFIEQMFFLISISFAYLKIKTVLTSNSVIEKWIDTIDKSMWNNFKDRSNNLKSWAILAHLLAAIATNDSTAYSESVVEFVEQVNLIDSDGYIPSELTRKDRSSAYTVYFTDPLIIVQYILKFVNNSTYDQTKLHNLINTVISIKRDPQYLVKQNKVKETQLTNVQKIEFIILYDAIFGSKFIKPENKAEYDKQLGRFKSNLDNITANYTGNLTSLFGI
jgi:hypothetical protein